MRITTELLTDFLNNKCDETTKREVEEWIAADKKNSIYLHELRVYWEAKDNRKQTVSFDVEKAYASFVQAISNRRQAPKRIWMRKVLRYAAVAALLISLAVTGMVYHFGDHVEQIVVVNNETVDRIISLPDGSRVSLHKGSSFEYPSEFQDEERFVKLKGEAFFEISKNVNKPFIIATEHTKTKVVGTSFRIVEDQDQTRISVTTGIVEFMDITNPENLTRLVEGDSAVFKERRKALLVKNYETNENGYNIRLLKFQNRKLGEICNDLQEIFQCKIRYGNDEIPEMKLTAVFENQNFDSIIESICFSLNLRIEDHEKFILLK